MNLFSQVWKYFGGSLGGPDRGTLRDAPISRASDTGEVVAEDRALQLTPVWAALRILSGIVASLPIQVQVKRGDNWEEDQSHYLLDALEYEPNPIMTGFDMRRALAFQLPFYGNAYAQIVRDGKGRAKNIYPLRPAQMDLKRIDDDTLIYEYKLNGRTAILAHENVLHVRGMSLDGTIGLNTAAYAAQAVGTATAAERHAAKFFKNRGRPSGVLMLDKALNPEQRKKIRESYSGLVDGGEDNENGLWVLESFAKYEPITASPLDTQLLESRAFHVAEFARMFGVPSILLMDQDKSTSWGSGVEQQILAFSTFTIEPNALKPFQSAFERWLLPPSERRTTRIRFDVEELLRMDAAAKAQFLRELVGNGIIDRNEARELIGYNPRPDANGLTAQSQYVPVSQLGKMNEGGNAQ